ncbi:MAG: helix-turn-helix domain-containing protein [Balneolales bacterium]
MVHVSVIVTRNFRPVSLAAVMDIFDSANRFCGQSYSESYFNIEQLVYGKNGIEVMDPQVQVNGKSLVSEEAASKVFNKYPDLVLIPAFNSDDIIESLQLNASWIPWLREQYENGAEVATFCTGAFLAGAAGLLDGKKATTHLMYAEAFKKIFPNVYINQDAVVTDDSGTYTSGGAISGFHLMLHLLNKYCGREISRQIAKMFAIDPDRVSQSYFGEFTPVKDHRDSLVIKLQDLIENKFKENVSVTEMMNSLPASRRTVYRRFKIATGHTPHEYLQQLRIETARQLLEQTTQSVGEVMYECGYNDAKTFRQLFRKTVGLAPKSYRRKYSP